MQYDNDSFETEEQQEAIAEFLQAIQDYGDIWYDIEVSSKIKAQKYFQNLLESLDEAGFWVFGKLDKVEYRKNIWLKCLIIRIIKKNNPIINN